MKKICFIAGNLNNSGGTERVTSVVANKLVEKNYDVSILSLVDGNEPFFTLNKSIQTYSLYPQKKYLLNRISYPRFGRYVNLSKNTK